MATIYYIRVFCVYVCMRMSDGYVYICVRVSISAHIYVRMFSVSKDAFVSCVVYERVTRLWIRMYVLWYKMKSRHALCTGKIDRGRKREKRNESKSKKKKRDKRWENREREKKNERNENRITVNRKFLGV